MDKRLQAGWFQRIAWSVLVWGSLGLLAWVPFLYVAIRRGRGSDWGALASLVLYELVTVPWAIVSSQGDGDSVLGVVMILSLLTATGMLLFALFDKQPPRQAASGPVAAPPVPGNPYLR